MLSFEVLTQSEREPIVGVEATGDVLGLFVIKLDGFDVIGRLLGVDVGLSVTGDNEVGLIEGEILGRGEGFCVGL